MPFRAHPSRQRGFSLLEVLIAALIFAIGFLGLAGLQARMLAAANSSYERSAAVMSAYTILDAMRAAVMSAPPASRSSVAQAYVSSNWRCAPPGGSGLPANDLKRWLEGMRGTQTRLPLVHPTACGRITALDAATFTYRVDICWDDSASGDNTDGGNCLGGKPATIISVTSRL